MSSHDCRISASIVVRPNTTLADVRKAIKGALEPLGIAFDSRVAAGTIALEDEYLTMEVDFHGHGGPANEDVLDLATAMVPLCEGPDWFLLHDYDTGDSDESTCPYFIAADDASLGIAKVRYGLNGLEEWAGSLIGKDQFAIVEDAIMALASGKPMEEAVSILQPKLAAPASQPDHDHMLQVYAPEVLGEHDDMSGVPEWEWIEKVASFSHTEVADRIVHIIYADHHDVPTKLQPVLDSAKAAGMNWVLFHLGQ